MALDLKLALSRVKRTRSRTKLTKSQKMNFKLFDKLAAEGKLKDTCDILHMHHHILQDDSERLSTKFIQDLIKGSENKKEEKLVLNLPEEFVEVKLTKGYTTFISKEDLEILNQAWHVSINKGSLMATSSIKTDKGVRKVLMHRVIMARILGRELSPKEYVVHIDRNPLNNTRGNLMICSAKQLG